MDTKKVPPPKAVDQLQAVLDSPEVARLVKAVEEARWTGRPGYPVRAMVGMCLVKSMYALSTWSRTVRLVAEHEGLQAVLGCAPSQWACYRLVRTLRERDGDALEQCISDVLGGLRQHHPNMGRDIAVDGSNLPAYANGRPRNRNGSPRRLSDLDASWGHRTAVSNRPSGTFYGYKIHAAVDVSTDLPLAWTVESGAESEYHFALPVIDRARKRGFKPRTAICDKGYDSQHLHQFLTVRNIAPVIPLRTSGAVKRGKHEPPHCAHGDWTFAGADYKRKATKWRCPTGECQPSNMWLKASRLHPLIPRETKKYRDLYTKRGAIEREFGRLKHEWSLLPLRVRGRARVQLHADLTILACLATRLASDRSALALAA